MDLRKLCDIESCEKPSRRHGMCVMHASRWKRYGDPSIVKKTPPGTVARYFRETVLAYEGNDCLFWPFTTAKGCAVMTIPRRRNVYVGRHICETLYGPAPSSDHEAAHACGNGHLGCVTPKHLRWATRLENRADMLIHDTRYRGSRHYLTTLTDADVRAIRTLLAQGTLSQGRIGERFGVSGDVVGCIHRGISWSWLD